MNEHQRQHKQWEGTPGSPNHEGKGGASYFITNPCPGILTSLWKKKDNQKLGELRDEPQECREIPLEMREVGPV